MDAGEGVAETAACVLFVAASAADAMCAFDTPLATEDVPATLRVTSLVSIILLAAPADTFLGARGSIKILLVAVVVAVGVVGHHVGSAPTRALDAVYVCVCLLAATAVCASNGIDRLNNAICEERTCSGKKYKLAMACLVYAGARQLRAARDHTELVERARIDAPGGLISAAGYASSEAVFASAFAGGVHIAFGATNIFQSSARSDPETRMSYLAPTVIVSFLSAMAATKAIGAQARELPLLFSRDSCAALDATCAVAERARRLALTHTPIASLWCTSMGVLVWSTLGRAVTSARTWQQEACWALAHACICAFGVYIVAGTPVVVSYESQIAALAVLSVASAWPVGVVPRSAVMRLFALGAASSVPLCRVTELLSRRGATATLTHPTNASLLWMSVMLAASALATGKGAASRACEAAAASTACALLFATLALFTASNGRNSYHITDADALFAIVDHFVPALVLLPLACRDARDAHEGGKCARKCAWIGGPFGAVIVNAVTLAASSGRAPPADMLDPTTLPVSALFLLLAWLAMGAVVV